MASRFGKYKPEEEKAVRKVEVAGSEVLRQLREAWKSVSDDGRISPDSMYARCKRAVKRLRCSAEDISRFNVSMTEFQDETGFKFKAGLFLSALINISKDSEFIIHTNHLVQPIDYLGYKNTKSITVNGDVHDDAGARMKSGSMTVNGNAGMCIGDLMRGGTLTIRGSTGNAVGSGMWGGSIVVEANVGGVVGLKMRNGHIIVGGNSGVYLGSGMLGGSILVNGDADKRCGDLLKGGSITVCGDASDDLGARMKSGCITVKGNTSGKVGTRMKGGEIHVEGDSAAIARNVRGGKIFHKGELIVDK
jgi:formylmethanofuran dehydrogenase subunit C